MVDRTQHCTGCKERQDRIAELEAALRQTRNMALNYATGTGASFDEAMEEANAALGDKHD